MVSGVGKSQLTSHRGCTKYKQAYRSLQNGHSQFSPFLKGHALLDHV
jgi:hypothetical protein